MDLFCVFAKRSYKRRGEPYLIMMIKPGRAAFLASVLDSKWTPEREFSKSSGCKYLRNLVGLPGFDPGNSCTPIVGPECRGESRSGANRERRCGLAATLILG